MSDAPDPTEATQLCAALTKLISTDEFEEFRRAVQAAHATVAPKRGRAAKRSSTKYDATKYGDVPDAGAHRKQRKSHGTY